MRVFLCLASMAVLVAARPEPPSSFGGSSFGGQSFGRSQSFGSDSYSAPQSAPSQSYNAPSHSYSAPSNSYSAPQPKYGPPAPVYGAPAQPPVIHKHVYVHVPPPEPTYYAPKKVYTPQVPQKHYKIVFIKAPTPPTPTAPVIPQFAQDEQKTLIYVLVKKPEEAPEIDIPTPSPTQPSKPEVYFIRYKTQKQEGYPAAQPPAQYGAPAAPSAPSDTYGGPAPAAPSSQYGGPSGSSHF